ncbi:hypothetical protein [Synechococcus sp. PCC 6312]|uniref:hypothetical protein n=1 Tax=Synechococcus sp. (strain ATCC 27167 / PCC 6312) TaxID=195253 RepID=UPI00029EEBF2|nr:hypothetical protein [Synechococcus sp. PCC 6312]AFY62628.1 hypothetical protein Syn6312_3610 [Synechococcus sp. PCC 6312]
MISLTQHQRQHWTNRLLLVAALWGLLVGVSSYWGWLQSLTGLGFALLVFLGIATPVFAYSQMPLLRAYCQSIPLYYLTLLHLWRIPAAVVFFYYGAQDLLPQIFVERAAWGDLVAGVLVIPVLMRPRSQKKYWAFHLFGMADFILAVGTGLTLTLLQVPSMSTIATFPIALIPAFGVGISGASHLLAWDILFNRRQQIK